jgi:SAM-dependent methyltransferase
MARSVDLYDNVYSDFESSAETAVRRAAFGEDIGQSSWLTADDWLRFADLAGVRETSRVLEVGSGSGGPAVYLATERGCHVTDVDINAHGVDNGRKLAAERGSPTASFSRPSTRAGRSLSRPRCSTRVFPTTRCATSRTAWACCATGIACFDPAAECCSPMR